MEKTITTTPRSIDDTMYYIYAKQRDDATGQTSAMSAFELDVTAPLPSFTYIGVLKNADKIIISSDIIYTTSDLNYTIRIAIYDEPQNTANVDSLFSTSETVSISSNSSHSGYDFEFVFPVDATARHFAYVLVENYHCTKRHFETLVFDRTRVNVNASAPIFALNFVQSPEGVLLAWTQEDNGDAIVECYKIEYGLVGETPITTVFVTETSHLLRGLSLNSDYSATVTKVTNLNHPESVETTFTRLQQTLQLDFTALVDTFLSTDDTPSTMTFDCSLGVYPATVSVLEIKLTFPTANATNTTEVLPTLVTGGGAFATTSYSYNFNKSFANSINPITFTLDTIDPESAFSKDDITIEIIQLTYDPTTPEVPLFIRIQACNYTLAASYSVILPQIFPTIQINDATTTLEIQHLSSHIQFPIDMQISYTTSKLSIPSATYTLYTNAPHNIVITPTLVDVDGDSQVYIDLSDFSVTYIANNGTSRIGVHREGGSPGLNYISSHVKLVLRPQTIVFDTPLTFIVDVCVTKQDIALGFLKVDVTPHAQCPLIGFNVSQVNTTTFSLNPLPYVLFNNLLATNRLPLHNGISNIYKIGEATFQLNDTLLPIATWFPIFSLESSTASMVDTTRIYTFSRPLPPLPSLPPTLIVTSKTVSSVSLSWVENDNGDTTVTDYLLEYKAQLASVWTGVVVSNSVSSYILNVLSSNTVYDLRVTKRTDLNNAMSSIVTDSTIKVEALPPTLSVASKTVDSVSLSWTENDNGDTTVTDYLLEYRAQLASIWTGVNTNSVSIKITGVDEYVYTRPFDVTEFRLTDFDGNILAYTIETDFLTYEYLLTLGGSVSTGSDIVGMSNTLQSFEYRMFWYGSNVGSYFNLIPVDPSALVARVDLVFSQYDRSSDVEITFRGQTHVVPSLPSNDQATWHGTSFEDMQKQTAVYNPSVVVTIMSKTSYLQPYNFTLEDESGDSIPYTITDNMGSFIDFNASWEPSRIHIPAITDNGYQINYYKIFPNDQYEIGDTFTLTYDLTKTVRKVHIGYLIYQRSVDVQIQVGGQTVLVNYPTYSIGPGGTQYGASIQEATFEPIPMYTLFGLESNTSYDFQVTKNTDVNSPVSSVVTDSTEPIEALPPTLSVASKTVDSVSLSWVSNSNGDAGLTGYELEYKKTSETTFASVAVVSTSKTLVGLDSNTEYDFRVTKITDLNSPVSSVVTDSTKAEALPPTLSVDSKTMSSVSLSWVENDNGDASVTGYELKFKKNSESVYAAYTLTSTIVSVYAAYTSINTIVIGLESNTAYDFRVTKNTDVNNPVSSVVTDSTAKADALPPTLSVASKTSSSISLSWEVGDNGDTNITNYLLQYFNTSIVPPVLLSVTVVSTATTKTLLGLESNTVYRFLLTKNTEMNNPRSSVVTDITAKADASPPTLSVASKTVSSVSLSWVVGDNGDASVIGYTVEYFATSILPLTLNSVNVVSTTTSETLSGLESNTAYHFRVIKNTEVNNPVSSVVIDSTLITRRIDMYMTEHSVKYSSNKHAYNVKIDELLFYDVYGVKCEYEITIVNPNMAGEGHSEVSMTYFYDRLTQFYRGAGLGWSVDWYIDPDLKQSFYDQIMISVQVPKNAFRMVTMFTKQDRSCGVFFDFPENPTGTPVFAHQTFDRETGGNIVGVMRDHYFTTDGTATGPPMFV